MNIPAADHAQVFAYWNSRANSAHQKKQLADAAEFWQKASRCPDSGDSRAARALWNRAVAQGILQEFQGQIDTFDEIRKRFSESSDPAIQNEVFKVLCAKALCQSQLKLHTAAIATYDEAFNYVGFVPKNPELEARALLKKSWLQRQEMQYNSALVACNEAITRLREAATPQLKTLMVQALIDQAYCFRQLNMPKKAVEVYTMVLNKYMDPEVYELQSMGEQSLLVRRHKSFDPVQKLWVYDTNDQELFGLLAKALEQMQLTQLTLSNQVPEQETFEYWNSLAEDAVANEQILRAAELWLSASKAPHVSNYNAAGSLWNRGIALLQLNRAQDALATHNEIVHRFADCKDPSVKSIVSLAFDAGGRAKRPSLNSNSPPTQASSVSDLAFRFKRGVLRRLENNQPILALKAVNELLTDMANCPSTDKHELLLANALHAKGLIEGNLKRPAEAVATFDHLIERLGKSVNPDIFAWVCSSLVCKGLAQTYLNEHTLALKTFDQALERFGIPTNSELKEGAAKTLFFKARTQSQMRQRQNAMVTLDALFSRFAREKDPKVRDVLSDAYELRRQLIQAQAPFWKRLFNRLLKG